MRLESLAVLLLAAATLAHADSDVGDVDFSNSGAPAAQASFLHGLAQLHNFEYEEAAVDFQAAEKADPGFAMAYWGEAMTYNHTVWQKQDRAAALKALAKLAPTPEARLAMAPTEREKDYLRAVEILYGDGDADANDFKYAAAMKEVHDRYPDDVDAAALYALALMGEAHDGRDLKLYLPAADILEPYFKAHPRHPGLAHYLIHALDDPDHAARALPAARAYSGIAVKSSHAQHMCSHIFVALGMWDEVVKANLLATSLDDAASQAQGGQRIYCGHYPDFLEYGYLEQGDLDRAKALLKDCGQETARAASQNDDSPLEDFVGMRTRYLIDSEEWDGDVARAAPPVGLDQHRADLFEYEFATGYAAAQRGDLKTARAAARELSKISPHLRPLPEWRIDSLQLEALILFSQGDRVKALILARRAADLEDSQPIEFGPPDEKPSDELLGELLLKAGRCGEAGAAFQKAAARTPGRAQPQRGLRKTSSVCPS